PWTVRQEPATTASYVYWATCGSAPWWRARRGWQAAARWGMTWRRRPAFSSSERGPVEHRQEDFRRRRPRVRGLAQGPHREGGRRHPPRLYGRGRRAAHAGDVRQRMDVQRRVLGRDRARAR